MRHLRRFTGIVAIATAVSTMLLTAVPARATFPGKNGRIAFRRYLNDTHTRAAIFTINTDGTGLLQLTHPRRGVAHEVPDWSPDGRWIAYERDWGTCCPETHPRHIFRIRADGIGRKDLTQPNCPALSPPVPTDTCYEESLPAWSPNGKRIAFIRIFGSCPPHCGTDLFDVFIMRANGTHVRRITKSPPRYMDVSVMWSPDGTRLVFVRSDEGRDPSRDAVFTVHVDGTHLHQLTPWRLDAGDSPDWSPDGRWILFRSHTGGGHPSNVYLVHPNGSGLHRITSASGGDFTWLSSSFSPDGTRITVGRYPAAGPAGNADVYVMNVDGSGLEDVTNSVKWDSAPDWGPLPT